MSKRSGQQCRSWAVRGSTVCRMHGGTAKQVKAKAQKNVAEWKATRELGKMGCAVDVHPLDALLEMVCEAAGNVHYLRTRVEDLHLTEVNDLTGVTEANALVKLYEQERDRLAKFSKMALDAGVDERQVRIAEAQGQQLAAVVRAAVAAAAVGGEQAGLKAAAEEMRRLRSA